MCIELLFIKVTYTETLKKYFIQPSGKKSLNLMREKKKLINIGEKNFFLVLFFF